MDKTFKEMDLEDFEVEYETQIVAKSARHSDDVRAWGQDAHGILTTILDELNAIGKLDFILLKHQHVATYWADVQKRRDRNRKYDVALDRLKTQFTEEELKLLRIRLPE